MLDLKQAISSFGAEAKAKLSNPSATGEPEDQLRADLLSALLNLGYQRAAADKAIDKVLKDASSPRFDEALRAVLRALMK